MIINIKQYEFISNVFLRILELYENSELNLGRKLPDSGPENFFNNIIEHIFFQQNLTLTELSQRSDIIYQ